MDIDPYRFATHPLTAGIGGALVGLKFAPGLSWVERFTNVAAGAACAGWVAPATAELFSLTNTSSESALSFAIGMFGMSIAAALFETIRAIKWVEIVTSWVKRNDGGSK